MISPLVEISESNLKLLYELRQKDIDRLLKGYQHLERFEEFFIFILLGIILLMFLYLVFGALKKKWQTMAPVSINTKLDRIVLEQPNLDQQTFLKKSELLLRQILKEHFNIQESGKTDLELMALFHKQPLLSYKAQGEQAISSIIRGRFGNAILTSDEISQLLSFLQGFKRN
jgi:hypothetical protein